jgi:hypothetical protein
MEQTKLGERHNFDMFDHPRPFGARYDSGICAALGVLFKSQQPGWHEEKDNFSTVRKARLVHSNLYKVLAHGGGSHLVTRSDKRRSFLSSDPTDSDWFDCFMKGLRQELGKELNRAGYGN